jgi:hypothetical protein
MGMPAWDEELGNRGAYGAIREQPATDSHLAAN